MTHEKEFRELIEGLKKRIPKDAVCVPEVQLPNELELQVLAIAVVSLFEGEELEVTTVRSLTAHTYGKHARLLTTAYTEEELIENLINKIEVHGFNTSAVTVLRAVKCAREIWRRTDAK